LILPPRAFEDAPISGAFAAHTPSAVEPAVRIKIGTEGHYKQTFDLNKQGTRSAASIRKTQVQEGNNASKIMIIGIQASPTGLRAGKSGWTWA